MMNRIKSIFISFYLMTALLFLVISVQKYIESELDWVWLVGIAIQIIPLAFIGKLFLVKTARTPAKLPVLSILQVILSIVVIFNTNFSIGLFKQPVAYALFTSIGWFLYVYWYSVLPRRRTTGLFVGRKFPILEFENPSREKVVTDQFLGQKTLYMFFRGNWCPLCMAQINEIADQYKELSSRGVQVVLISPQSHGHSQKLALKFDVPFHFLVDRKNKAARKINLEHKSGTPMGMEIFGYSSDTVLPTIIITNEEGEIVFLDQTDNYRVRPEPDVFLKIIDQIGDTTP